MAAITVAGTALEVKTGGAYGTPEYGNGVAGADLAIGQLFYLDTAAANVAKLFDTNAAGTDIHIIEGMAIAAVANGNAFVYLKKGYVVVGSANLTQGEVYLGSATPGGFEAVGSLTSGWYTAFAGIAYTSSILLFHPVSGGVVK